MRYACNSCFFDVSSTFFPHLPTLVLWLEASPVAAVAVGFTGAFAVAAALKTLPTLPKLPKALLKVGAF